MIWAASNPVAARGGDAGGTADLLAAGSAALGLPAEVLAEATRAVLAYDAGRPPPLVAPGWRLAQALWSVGQPAAAHFLAASLLADGPLEGATRRALEQCAFDPGLGFLLELRVLRPLRWQHLPEPAGWALDYSRLQRDPAGELSLFRLPGLLAMLRTLAGVWDPTAGRGTLALKAWPAPRETEDCCRDFLERCRSARGWRAAPRIVHLH